jgi:hypothetical protein
MIPILVVTAAVLAQAVPEFVPEFKLPCHPSEPVWKEPSKDPSADRFGPGPWYVSENHTLWAAWQPLVSGTAGNRMMWIKPPGATIEIHARRLDGDAPPFKVSRKSAYVEKGFEANRLHFPEDGCWEVAATANSDELIFVVEVRKP